MNQYPVMPPTPGLQSSAVPGQPNPAKIPTQPGISPAVQALMNTQAQRSTRPPAPGGVMPPGARPVSSAQQAAMQRGGAPNMAPTNAQRQPVGQPVQADPAAAQNFAYATQMADVFNQPQQDFQAQAKPMALNPQLPPEPLTGRDYREQTRAQFAPGMQRRLSAFNGRQVR